MSVIEVDAPAPKEPRKWYRTTFFNAFVIGGVGFVAPGLWNAMNALGAGGAQKPFLWAFCDYSEDLFPFALASPGLCSLALLDIQYTRMVYQFTAVYYATARHVADGDFDTSARGCTRIVAL
ncbi:hypothetical protein VTN00DRAFT_5767 [Thermoascus crustaceus]|uniref:uncharacterized protein n=1 Tax=Thermoascus crustaceus TaxID=5088 RepID=UPI003742DA9D